jgi:hypothetical protein
MLGTTTFSVLCCLSITRNSTNSSDSWTNSGIFGDNNGKVGMTIVGTFSPVTVRAYMSDGADKHADLSVNLATKVVLMMWFDGTYLSASINDGTPVQVSCGNLDNTSAVLTLGRMRVSYYSTIDLYDFTFVKGAVVSSDDRASYYAYCQSQYGVS